MSPRRIETRSITEQGIRVTQIKEADQRFDVGPADAMDILGVPRTTLFRYDGPDVRRVPLKKRAWRGRY